MGNEKIEEIAKILRHSCDNKCRRNKYGEFDCHYCEAEVLYNAGYRKQSEGEWIEHIEKPSWLEDDVEVYYNCSVCGTSHWSITPPFCPNCGAKMKGGE